MSMMTLQILKFMDFTKTRKCISIEYKASFFLQIKKKLIAQQGLYDKKYFCSRGKLKVLSTKIQQEAETVSGTVLQQRCSRIYG